MRRGLGFWTGLGFTLLISAFLILPVLASVVAGVTTNQFIGLSSGLTTRWVLEVWANYGGTVLLSLQIALATLAVSLLLGIPAAYVLARHAGVTARLVEEALVMPVAVPGLATALGLILAYGAAGNLRSSWLFILVGHVVFCLPFMVRSVLAVLLAIDLKALEEAARACGAGWTRRFLGVVLPNIQGGILAGSLMVVTLSLGEFNMTLLLHTPFTRTLPVGLADAYTALRTEMASAYTLIFFALIVPLLSLMQWAASRAERLGTLR
jgi:putative spermidine/putrescine transport system permease protein